MERYDWKELQERIERFRSLERRKSGLIEEKNRLLAAERHLAAELAKEEADVEKWEGSSLAAFFYSMMGKREERLEKEKQEAYETAVKRDTVLAELAAVEKDLQKAEGELLRLKGCEEEYRKAVEEKAAILAAEGKDNGILELEQKKAQLKEEGREIKEAMTAGECAMNRLQTVQQILREAESWGTFDMLGGGMLSTMMKHEKLQSAQEKIQEMQIELRRFQTELADVALTAELDVKIDGFSDGFSKAADYIFDCMLVDWQIQDGIYCAQEKVGFVEREITEAFARLRQMEAALEEKQIRLQEEWQKKVMEG